MNLLDRLKELDAKAKAVPYQPGNIDERMDTSENFDFAYALQDAWPKLLAVVEAAEMLCREIQERQCNAGDVPVRIFHSHLVVNVALAALDQ